MDFSGKPISDESVFPLDSWSLTLGGVDGSHNISAGSSIPRDKAVNKQTLSRHSTSKKTGNFDLTDLELHMRDVGAHGPRLLQYYGGNTLEAQIRTVNEIEKYRGRHNQSPITPIGPQGPRGGESQLHWQCNICERIFDTFQKVAVHLTSCEWGLANWRCLEISCNRVYQSRNELVRHKSTSHPHASPDEYEDTKSEILPPSTRVPTGPRHFQPTPLSQIPDYPLQGKVMPQSRVGLKPPSPVVPQAPPATMYYQHTRASPTMPRHPFDRWSSPHVEASQNAPGDVTVLPTTRNPATYENPLECAPHRTQAMDSNRQWLQAGYGVAGVFDTSPLFRMPSDSSNGNLVAPDSDSHYPITTFHSQCNPVNSHGPYQPSSQFPHSSLAPSSSISYFMNLSPRNPAPNVQYTQQDRSFQQVQTQGVDTNVTDRNYPSPADAWLHYDSELKTIALYQPAATSKQSSYPANVRTVDRSGGFLSTDNSGKYVQENPYGHQMVRLRPISCSLRPTRRSGWEEVIMAARDGRNTNTLIEYYVIKTSIYGIYFVVVFIRLRMLMAKIMDNYSHSTRVSTSENYGFH